MTDTITEEPQASKAISPMSDASNRRSAMRNEYSTNRRDFLSKRGSALIATARASLVRTRGRNSVKELREADGHNFEGYANIHRGEGDFDAFNICCRKKSDLYFVLIKGFHCFVFKNEGSNSPKYVIELMNRNAVIQPPHDTIIPHVPHPGAGDNTGYTTVHLKSSSGDVEYKFTFADVGNTTSEFCNAVAVNSSEASNAVGQLHSLFSSLKGSGIGSSISSQGLQTQNNTQRSKKRRGSQE